MKINLLNNTKIKIFKYCFFFFIFFYPNNQSFYFDGLPFTNKYETLFFCVFIPLTLFFKSFFNSKKFLSNNYYIFNQNFLINSYTNGVNVKQFFTLADLYNDKYIKTFDTFWNKDVSYLQKYP